MRPQLLNPAQLVSDAGTRILSVIVAPDELARLQ